MSGTHLQLVPAGSLVEPTPSLDADHLYIQLDLDKWLEQNGDDDKFNNIPTAYRAANFLTASMLFLKDNVDLHRPLRRQDIKPRLLGHWGTCPAISLVYLHCNYLITQRDVDMFLVVGPGHGAPAVLANLYLEGTLGQFDSRYTWSSAGLHNLVRGFSWPSGFPSHINAEVPGSIHEGGELGYALSVSFGAIMDNPDLIVTCIVGDGEAETGPTAAAWHSYKFIDPVESGAVLPILNLNGYKIANPTIFGMMSNDELATLFSGYGYQVRFVENLDLLHVDMGASMDWAYREIKHIQRSARSGSPVSKPRWPLLVLRTPKGWTGPKFVHGNQVLGTWRSHQIPLPNVHSDDEEFSTLETWLLSYKPKELFDNGVPIETIRNAYPAPHRMMGRNLKTYATYFPLKLADFRVYATREASLNLEEWKSCMKVCGDYLAQVVANNRSTFRIFSPDELESNKLSAILKETSREFQWDPSTTKDGRVLEVLSEHQCQGWMQGYTLTGRTGLFPSYESFLPIVTTMVIQYSKFQKVARETKWHLDVPSLNYIESSTLWRQEHNGYSHQNPSFIDTLINLKTNMVRIYLPPDANCLLSTVDHCLASKNYVNLVISSKQPMPIWLSVDDAVKHCRAGASIWRQYSSYAGTKPDVVLACCGNETTFETIAAAALLRRDAPELRVRVVNVTDLMVLDGNCGHPHALTEESWSALFTEEAPIIFTFHGYPAVIRGLVFDRRHIAGRLKVLGYNEEGTTTTPFKMLTVNGCSRYHIAIDALLAVARRGRELCTVDIHVLVSEYNNQLRSHDRYILEHGDDPDYVKTIPSPENERV